MLSTTTRGMKLGWSCSKVKRKSDNNDNDCGNIKRKKQRHTIKEGDRVNLSRLLFTKQRDYLIKYNDPNIKVQAIHLEGKVIVLHFVPLLPLDDYLWMYISSLVDIYNEIQPKYGFEVVFIGIAFPDDDGKKIPNAAREKNFENLFSLMPWTAIPFSDVKSRKYLARQFSISSHISCMKPFSLAIDPTGVVLQCGLDDLFHFYGARGYPFSAKRFKCVFSEDSEDEKHPSIAKLLTSPERDFVINKDNKVVPIQNLENKVVALYFYEDDLDEPLEDDELTQKIKKVYKELAKKKVDFEVVLVYIYESPSIIGHTSEESFRKRLNTMPWLALPYKDPICKKLMGVAQFNFLRDSSGPDRRLAIIDPRRKVLEPYSVDILYKFGISAYPFTRQRVAELKVERIKKLRLDMFFDPNTIFTQKYGPGIQLSQLMGKRIILMIEEGWVTKYAKFFRRLKARYLLMKGTIDEFEVIHIPLREQKDVAAKPWLRQDPLHKESDVGCFDGEDFPWLRHPVLSEESDAYELLASEFGCCYAFGLVAFDRDGSIVRRTIYPSIDRNNMDFPFYAAGMEKEVLMELIRRYGWDGWS